MLFFFFFSDMNGSLTFKSHIQNIIPWMADSSCCPAGYSHSLARTQGIPLPHSNSPSHSARGGNDAHPYLRLPIALFAPLRQHLEFHRGLWNHFGTFVLDNDVHDPAVVDVGVESAVPGWVHGRLLLHVHLAIFCQQEVVWIDWMCFSSALRPPLYSSWDRSVLFTHFKVSLLARCVTDHVRMS